MISLFKVVPILIVLSSAVVYGQTFEVEQESYTIRSHYGYDAKRIDSLNHLPEKIQLTLKLMLTERLGRHLYEKLIFEDGQVVDLDNYFASNLPSRLIIPKYDLIFLLSDSSLGIKSYCLNVDMDLYGQVLSINWPSKKVETYQFINNKELYDYALQYAEKHNLKKPDMILDLEYNKSEDKLYWLVTYKNTNKDKPGYSDYSIRVALHSLKIIRENMPVD